MKCSSQEVNSLKDKVSALSSANDKAEKQISQLKAESEKKIIEYKNLIEQTKADFESEINLHKKNIEKLKNTLESEGKIRLQAEQKSMSLNEKLAVLEKELETAKIQKPTQVELIQTGSCECCGRNDIALNKLNRIDSGQLFCQDCFQALKQSFNS